MRVSVKRLTVVVNHVLDIAEDLGIATVGFLGHVGDARRSRVENPGGLGVENEGDCEKALDPFCEGA